MDKVEAKKYNNIHMWIRYHYGNAKYCSNNSTHKAKKFEWANIDGISAGGYNWRYLIG